MRAVDTNVLIRLITRDDRKPVSAAETFVAEGAWISHVVLAETAWVLDSVYGLGPGAIATAIEMLLDHRDLTLQDPGVVAAALRGYRGKPKVGFSDHLVLESARQVGHLPVGTFDRELGRLDGAQRL